MKLNRKVFYLIGVGILILSLMLVEFIWMDWSLFLYALIAVSLSAFIAFMAVYIQKTSKPHCKKCGHKLKLQNKQLINQEEEIRYGQFVFIYKYQYDFECPHCNEVVHINKTVKK